MTITNDIRYIGVNDHDIDLFEGQYIVPEGMAYNSYVIIDEKIAVMDTVSADFGEEWLANLENVLAGRKPDYLIIHHMEPDHSANIDKFISAYPEAAVVGNAKTFEMIDQFFGSGLCKNKLAVKNGDTLSLGRHELTFLFAPMVHWPEVMMSYDGADKALFSADAFGKFGALDCQDKEWDCEARRYYMGIVGKYGMQVQTVLKKAAALDIKTICPLHGPVLTGDLSHYTGLYDIWSSYGVESEGVCIAYTSVYGNTKRAAELLAKKLEERGCKAAISDLARCDMAEAVEDAFRYGKLVLATTTYNADIFPFMRTFIESLTEREYKNRTVAFIENGTWAPLAAKIMKGMFEKSKNINFVEPVVHIRSALNEASSNEIDELSKELCRDYIAQDGETADKNDLTALFNIGYGLYVVTSNDGKKDNGLIVNTVTQVTNSPNRIAVTINKDNYSHHVIKQTGKMNINCLSVDAPFSVFENFGFRSGRNVNKFEGSEPLRSDNGLAFLPRYINSFMSLKVEQYVDLDTHGMFICSITEARVISDAETMTYTYYQKNVKPRPQTEGKKGFVCKVCGYIYEGDELPEDFICPLCKHGAADFEPIK